jgi:hypothetical protein
VASNAVRTPSNDAPIIPGQFRLLLEGRREVLWPVYGGTYGQRRESKAISSRTVETLNSMPTPQYVRLPPITRSKIPIFLPTIFLPVSL